MKYKIILGEIWIDIPGYEGRYRASNMGRIKSIINKEIIMKSDVSEKGYLKLSLVDAWGFRHKESVHRLVAKTFIPNPFNLPEINHKDEVKSHNYLQNLEWCTSLYNNNYGSKGKRRRNI